MDIPICSLLLRRPREQDSNGKRFQYVLRWAIARLLASRSKEERSAWSMCLLGDTSPLRLSLSYDNYINLCLLSASASILYSQNDLRVFVSSYQVHTQCINKFICQSQSINDSSDDWKWSALCALIPLVKLNFSAEQFMIQQASRRLDKIMDTTVGNWFNCIGADRLKIDQALYAISMLLEVSSKV